MTSQPHVQQGLIRDLPISSKQQPGRLPRRRPVGVELGVTAMALAALGISLVLCYAGGCAIVTQRGYAAMTLRREIEDLRAENALLRYQINLSLSTPQVEVAATRLGLRPADPVEEVDYILYPGSEQQTEVAASDPAKEQLGVRSTLAGLAARVADSVGARAEASTVEDHRR